MIQFEPAVTFRNTIDKVTQRKNDNSKLIAAEQKDDTFIKSKNEDLSNISVTRLHSGNEGDEEYRRTFLNTLILFPESVKYKGSDPLINSVREGALKSEESSKNADFIIHSGTDGYAKMWAVKNDDGSYKVYAQALNSEPYVRKESVSEEEVLTKGWLI